MQISSKNTLKIDHLIQKSIPTSTQNTQIRLLKIVSIMSINSKINFEIEKAIQIKRLNIPKKFKLENGRVA